MKRSLLHREATAADADESGRETSPGPETQHRHPTAIEDSLPQVQTDGDAIEEYELMRASQLQEEAGEHADDALAEDTAQSRLDRRKWIRGRSSIYVDAFNLALDTVLEDEAHLFDERERVVFEHWRKLDYEAQYLYVAVCTLPVSDPKVLISPLQICALVLAQDVCVAPPRPCRVSL